MSGAAGLSGRRGRTYCPFPPRILFGFLIIAVLLLAVPVPAGASTPGPRDPVRDSVNSTAMNSTAGSPAMLAPAMEPATEPAKEYNRGYPIPVPVLIVTGVIVVAAGGFMARRRRIRR